MQELPWQPHVDRMSNPLKAFCLEKGQTSANSLIQGVCYKNGH